MKMHRISWWLSVLLALSISNAIAADWPKLTEAKSAQEFRQAGTQWRLVNVWSLWCGPCVEKFPAIVSLAKELESKELQLITVSLDEASERQEVKTFLHEHKALQLKHSQHHLMTGDLDKDLCQALDPEGWKAVESPYVVLINPKGEVVWRQAGSFNVAELKALLLQKLQS